MSRGALPMIDRSHRLALSRQAGVFWRFQAAHTSIASFLLEEDVHIQGPRDYSIETRSVLGLAHGLITGASSGNE